MEKKWPSEKCGQSSMNIHVIGGYQTHVILNRVPTVMEILEKIAVMESHGKVLDYEKFPKKSWKVAGCHEKVMELLVLMAVAAF